MPNFTLGPKIVDRVVRGAEKWEVRVATMDNGLRILFQVNPKRPTVCLQINLYRPPVLMYDHDVRHMLEHLMISGSNRIQRLIVSQELDRAGSGGAWSFPESICIGIHCAPNQISQLLPHLCRAARADWISRKMLENERPLIQTELQTRYSTLSELVYAKWLKGMFPNSPYSRPCTGLAERMQQIAFEDVIQFRDALLSGPNIVVGASGNIDVESVMRIIGRELGDLPKNEETVLAAKSPAPHPGIHLIKKNAKGLTSFLLGQKVHITPEIPPHRSGDYWESIASSIVTALLGQLWSSRVYVEGQRLGYHELMTGGEEFSQASTLWLTGVTNDPTTMNKVMLTYIRDLARLRRDGPSKRELNRTLRNLRSTSLIQSESLKKRTISGCDYLYQSGTYESYAENLSNMRKLTPSQVRHWIRRYLPPDSGRLTVVGNLRGFKPIRTIERFCSRK